MKKLYFKKLLYYIKIKRQDRKRALVSIVILLISFIVPIVFIKSELFNIHSEDALVGIASIVVTALSAVFLVFQLRDSEHITCCNMLAEMNLTFIENTRLMLLYQKLEESYRNPEIELEVINDDNENHVHTSDIVAYFTFFEVLNEFVKHKIVSIAQLDDLFGYRFFILVHNKYIQSRELFAVPSSYVNIFQLYDTWMEYRKINVTDKLHRLVIMQENCIPEFYLKNKTYLQEKLFAGYEEKMLQLPKKEGSEKDIKELKLVSLYPYNLTEIEQLQNKIVDYLKDKSIFQPSTKEEILESMMIDACYGLYDDSRLVALSIMVYNRKSNRNLCVDWEKSKKDFLYTDYLTFDTIQVDPDYRGYGIQQYFLSIAEDLASNVGAKYIVATVSPENTHSLNNFKQKGFESHDEKNPYIKYGSKRILIRKKYINALR